MKKMIIAVCTYNRADALTRLIGALRNQEAQIPCEILVVNNNSTDHTIQVLEDLALKDGYSLRFVTEKKQGIVHARNRAIKESASSDFMAFIDDDELPEPGWIKAAIDALDRELADCVGGKIRVDLPYAQRPAWLEDELLNFLGRVDNGDKSFWIMDKTTPVWSGNVAYRTSIFSGDLCFDHRYNRQGHVIGGGSDEIMFNSLLKKGMRIRYRPEMGIRHLVETWRLKRNYFIRLHYRAGWKKGRWEQGLHRGALVGIPPFMVAQLFRQMYKAIAIILLSKNGLIRQAMNCSYDMGMIAGFYRQWKKTKLVK